MAGIAISVDGLGKAYVLPQHRHSHGWRSRLSRHLRQHFGRVGGATPDDQFWALRDVSFEVREGESLGIIGKNGSGKSTLLKILSGVTRPTTGRAVLRGRVGSLLEVGTGFHPDLTGRQNIVLSGMLLGMSKADVLRRFDKIVDFAGIGEFIDVPVKRYSSGMFVRLAYSVASNLDTDILILDEVLAVGDAEFTERSKRNVEDLVHGGRTILFVSHSMPSISDVCQNGMVLSRGQCVYRGSATDAVTHYMQMIHGIEDTVHELEHGPAEIDLTTAKRWDDKPDVVMTSVTTMKLDGTGTRVFETGEGIRIRIGYEVTRETMPYFSIFFIAPTGDRALTVYSNHGGHDLRLAGRGFVECVIPDLRLISGDYSLMLDFGRGGDNPQSIDCVPNATVIRLRLGSYLGGFGLVHGQGWIAQKSEWAILDAGAAQEDAAPRRAATR
jgi:lipopolysaccharide transport system ATP-binding protein